MQTARAKGLKLFVFVVLPLTIAVISMLANNFLMLQGIAESVNARDERRTHEAVQAAFLAINQRLEGTVADNANWDDAVINTSGPIDPEWMQLTWGMSSSDINYDAVYVLDADGRRLSAYRAGRIEETAPDVLFGTDIFRLITELKDGRKEFNTVSSLMMTQQGLASVAVGPIVPSSDTVPVPQGRPNLLLMARFMTPEVISAMGQQFIVQGLSVHGNTAAESSIGTVRDRWGNSLTHVHWISSNPGAEASRSYANNSLFAIAALIAAMLPVSIYLAGMLTRLERKEAESYQAARIDSLSGLPNRLRLHEHLATCIIQAETSNVALAYIDLDGFKFVNDAYDHDTGDKLIQAVAKGVLEITQDRALLSRLGGDEFALVVTGPRAVEDSRSLASRIVSFVSTPFDIDGRSISIGASVGIASTGDPALPAAELMRQADIAMYAAKDSGRNRYKMFDETLDDKRVVSVEIAEKLRQLVAASNFDHVYQPLVSSNSHRISRLELLARWPQSAGESYSPDKFIPVAEECGLIGELGLLLLDRAMGELAAFPTIGLSVNISPTQLVNRRLASQIRALAARHNFGLARLEVEVTESVLIKQPDIARSVIQDLRANGIRIALDDFGAGYASLGYLRQFQFDVVKLDRSLTQRITSDIDVQNIVQGTIMIARGLSAEVVAEGVETADDARLLQLAGCTHLQGYHFGRPQPLSGILNLLGKGERDSAVPQTAA